MPEITLRVVMDGPDPILLYTEAERLRLVARMDDLYARAAQAEAMQMAQECRLIRLDAEALRREIAIDDEVAEVGPVLEVRVRFAEPTLDHLAAVRQAASSLPAAKQAAYQALDPTAVAGWDGPLHFRFFAPIADACYAAIDYQPSEDKRFFLIRRRRERSD